MNYFSQSITRILSLLLTISLLASLPVQAHHSTAAFDETAVIKIVGTIKQFRWINPHSSFKIEGDADGDHPDGLWTVEMTAANALMRLGWKRTTIKEGDKVTVFVHPLRNAITLEDGSQGCLYIGIILPDGTTLGRVDGKPGRYDQGGN
ncbi:MAG: hypothetical protein HW386_1206 [Gammaproteobacteria bacterium]|nr:hypothetical protein [Gammaproteobacteria bacterium]